jgi:PAS domain S-box-containing protein
METDSGKKGKLRRSRRNTEEELKEYQAKFQTLFDNVSSGVAIYKARNDGEDFVFVDFNPAAEEIEDIKKEKLIGKSVAEVFPGVKEFGLFDVFRRVYKTGTPEHHPISVYKDERIAGWRENFVYRLPSGQIVAVYDDISARKRTELVTQMTDQCFRAIADYTYDWEVWIGPTGRALWTNPAAERVTGYSIKELMSMSDYPRSLIYEQDRPRIVRAFSSALKGSTGNDVQFRIVRKDGKIIWAAMSWQPIYDNKGNSLGHRESIRDISEQKEAEQAVERAKQEKESILDSLRELVVYQDKDMNILWVNRAAYESVELKREEIIGRRCYELWAARGEPCVGCPVVRAIETGRTEEGERVMPDGRTWLILASPVQNEQGNVTGAVEIRLDITERKRLEEALRRSKEKCQRLAQGREIPE